MKRRDLLKYTALATGAAVSVPLASVLLSGCKADISENDLDYQLKFFDEEEFSLVRQLVDIILPKTDSPAASEVKVHQMMDQFVGEVYDEPSQADYRKGFDALSAYLEQNKFQKQNAAEQLVLLQQISDAEEATQKAFLNFKQQTIAYYLTTEEIGMNYLNYLPVPGQYEPCITLEAAGGKAWAL